MRTRTPVFLKLAFLVLVASSFASCGGGGGGNNNAAPPPPPQLTSINLSQIALTLDRWADKAAVSAQAVDQNGNNMTGAAITWSSSDDTIATVDASGNVTSWLAGNVDLTAQATLGSTTVTETVSVAVAVQQNSNCVVPGTFPTQGPANPPALWDIRRLATQFLPTGAMGQVETARQITLDVDRDGDPDLLSMKHTLEHQGIGVPIETAHRVWLNDGSAVFTDGTAAILGANVIPWNAPRHMAYGDFDADGFEDIVVFQQGWEQDPTGCGVAGSCLGGPNLLLMPRPGDLADVAPTNFSPYDTTQFTHSGAVGDVDCDGDTDIFEAQWGSGSHHLQLNSGAGTFVADDSLIPQELMPDISIASTALCDLDRDGDLDLVTGLPDSSTMQFVRISVNDGFGRFRMLDADVLPDVASSDGMDCADLNLDGYNDIIPSPGTAMVLLENLGDMSFADVTSVALPANPSGGTSNGLGVIDLNGDGWPEITPSSDSAIYWNDGDGTFTRAQIPWLCCGTQFTVADFDSDGNKDIFHHASRNLMEPDTVFLNASNPAPVKSVFATSSLYTGDLGGLTGADAICQQHATNAGLPGTHVALLSDSTTHAMNRLTHGQFRRTGDNAIIAESKMEFSDGLVLNAISNDEFGATIIVDTLVRTGTNHQTNRRQETGVAFCSDWSRATNEVPGLAAAGSALGLLNNWIWTEDRSCSEPQRLYCFQE